MSRQDIYGTIGDDILGQTGNTSSIRGKVRCISIWINTDVAGEANIDFCFDKDDKNVVVEGDIPRQWVNKVRLKDVV